VVCASVLMGCGLRETCVLGVFGYFLGISGKFRFFSVFSGFSGFVGILVFSGFSEVFGVGIILISGVSLLRCWVFGVFSGYLGFLCGFLVFWWILACFSGNLAYFGHFLVILAILVDFWSFCGVWGWYNTDFCCFAGVCGFL